MPFLSTRERAFLGAVSNLAYGNPFVPERTQHEREALGPDFCDVGPMWCMRVDNPEQRRVNAWKIAERVETLLPALRERLTLRAAAPKEELELYEDAALYVLYHRYRDQFRAVVVTARGEGRGPGRLSFYASFLRDWMEFLDIPGVAFPSRLEPEHVFASFFQVYRAFRHVFWHIVGSSMPAARLRAAVWQSLFTHDMRRYRDRLYARMGDVTTLIMGPSGTGKELVASAIGLSQYIPFDPETSTFAQDFAASFHALNPSALPSTLIESELFGHKRGAFTGAVSDRRGWLETCQPGGTVFLDEIGDLDPAVQVKLLRVIETRTFQPLGETTDRQFHGKIIAATNRDLAEAMHQGQFREDFYYRLCSDVIVTPSLQEQLRESPGVLGELLLFIAQRVAGDGAEALADEVEAWINKHLGSDYPWPGNIRELEQCVRNVMVRHEYQPPRPRTLPARDELTSAIDRGTLTAEELLRRYCTLVYAQTGSYQETAQRLQLDRRTIKSKIDQTLLAEFRRSV